METILCSACLLGVNCDYRGGNRENEKVLALAKTEILIPWCPEVYAGLPTPRPATEIRNGRVIAEDGEDETSRYWQGAVETLALVQRMGIRKALMRDFSPSCGVNRIYSGRFDGILVPGRGIVTELLISRGIDVIAETDLE